MALLFLSSTALASSPRPNPDGCSNDQCVTDAANLGIVLGLIGATVAPLWLKPFGARSFLTHQSGDVRMGGFLNRSQYAGLAFDISDIPESSFGFQTRLALTQLSGGEFTNLRYHFITDYALAKTIDVRWALGSGVAVEKLMETKPIDPGVPVMMSFEVYLSGVWRIRTRGTVVFAKQPVYRGEVQGIRVKRKSSEGLDIHIGYEYEDHRLSGETTHYLTVGTSI